MMPQRERWRQLCAAFERLAACQGVPSVRLRPGGWGSRGQTVRDPDGGFTVWLARRFVRRAEWVELVGVLAHELQHAYYGHPQVRPRRAAGRLLMVVALAVVLVCVVSMVLLLGLVLSVRPAGYGWWLLPAWLGLSLLLLGVDARVRERRERRRGKWRVVEEIQADLGAARLVGKEPVLAALRGARRVGRYRARVTDWRQRFTYWLWRTHPPRSVRITAVRAFSFDEDAELAAQRVARQLAGVG